MSAPGTAARVPCPQFEASDERGASDQVERQQAELEAARTALGAAKEAARGAEEQRERAERAVQERDEARRAAEEARRASGGTKQGDAGHGMRGRDAESSLALLLAQGAAGEAGG